VYDRTKTVVGRHVGRGQATPLHPEAVAFASHYQFAIRLCAPRRPQAKGRVERQVQIVRTHVLDGREFDSLGAMDKAFAAWLPIRRAQVHRTHGEVIGVRAERDRAALGPLPERPYVVCDRHTRRVAKDCLISGRPIRSRGWVTCCGVWVGWRRPRSCTGRPLPSFVTTATGGGRR
jgi:hypothetical protein